MKKLIILTLVAFSLLVTTVTYATELKDEKAMASSIKKAAEFKSALLLTPAQEKKVQEILYSAFKNVNMIYNQQDLTKQKIARYNNNSLQVQIELKNVLTARQYEKYLSPGRGH